MVLLFYDCLLTAVFLCKDLLILLYIFLIKLLGS